VFNTKRSVEVGQLSTESLLALRDDWRYISLDTSFDLPPGHEKTLFESKKRGYVIYSGLLTNNPLLEWTGEIETGQGKSHQKCTLADLYALGLILPQNAWFISKFDIPNSLYAMVYAPSTWGPFVGGVKYSVCNTTSSVIKVIRAGLLAIEFAK
jgi:hypothetical protein